MITHCCMLLRGQNAPTSFLVKRGHVIDGASLSMVSVTLIEGDNHCCDLFPCWVGSVVNEAAMGISSGRFTEGDNPI